jgi:hypothetical protein
MCYYDIENAKFSIWIVKGMAFKSANRSWSGVEVCWSVDGSGWFTCTTAKVGSCAVWLSGIIARAVSCSDHS